jgi:hypothetical protein
VAVAAMALPSLFVAAQSMTLCSMTSRSASDQILGTGPAQPSSEYLVAVQSCVPADRIPEKRPPKIDNIQTSAQIRCCARVIKYGSAFTGQSSSGRVRNHRGSPTLQENLQNKANLTIL